MASVLNLLTLIAVFITGIQLVTSVGYLGAGPYEKPAKPRFPNRRCDNGFYGIWCNKECVQDSHCKGCQHCVSVICHQESCARKCDATWVGPHCNKKCLHDDHCKNCEHCASVKCHYGSCVRKCEDNWWGSSCVHHCNQHCMNGSCNGKDGRCDHGCKTGYFGPQCRDKCNTNCLYEQCSRQDGSCTNGCKDGFFNQKCNRRCSELARNCKICLQDAGKCTTCQDGWYGPGCQDRCGEGCSDGVCDISGSCTCREGYFGQYCQERIKPYSKFWQIKQGISTINYTMTGTGCMIDGKVRQRHSIFTLPISGPCIQYKCGRKHVYVSKKRSGCPGGATCLRGKVTTDGAVLQCKVRGRTNRITRKITFIRKLIIKDKVAINYTLTDSGCEVEGQLRSFNKLFTIRKTGPCIKYECTRRGFYLATAKSACFDGVKCWKRANPTGCKSVRCSLLQRLNRKTNTTAISTMLTVRDRDCKNGRK